VAISVKQIRAARGLLGWTQAELAEAAGVSRQALNGVENGSDPKQSTINAIERALMKGGIQFIPRNGGGEGVRLRK
jgi:transcriptional regulator with XRE-family HTH domain